MKIYIKMGLAFPVCQHHFSTPAQPLATQAPEKPFSAPVLPSQAAQRPWEIGGGAEHLHSPWAPMYVN